MIKILLVVIFVIFVIMALVLAVLGICARDRAHKPDILGGNKHWINVVLPKTERPLMLPKTVCNDTTNVEFDNNSNCTITIAPDRLLGICRSELGMKKGDTLADILNSPKKQKARRLAKIKKLSPQNPEERQRVDQYQKAAGLALLRTGVASVGHTTSKNDTTLYIGFACMPKDFDEKAAESLIRDVVTPLVPVGWHIWDIYFS
jgi:hypothetical protein